MIGRKLVLSDREWARRARSDPDAPRNLDVREVGSSTRFKSSYSSQLTSAPFVVKKIVLLILRPELFLPEDRPLLINTHRVLRKPGGPLLSASNKPSWTQYHPQHNHPYLVDPSGQEFTEYDFVSERSQEQSLSVFSLLVNANSKLQAAKQRNNYPVDVLEYISSAQTAIEAILFVPHEILIRTPAMVPPVPPIPSSQDPSITIPGTSTRSRRSGKDPQGQAPGTVGPKDGGVAEEERSDLDGGVVEDERPDSVVDFEDVDYYSEEDDEPDTTNGLTFSEMETVIQRVSDGTISAEERAEAAMLMLGMAGGELFLLSITSFSLSDSRH